MHSRNPGAGKLQRNLLAAPAGGSEEQPSCRHILSTQGHPPDPPLSTSEELVHIKIIPSKRREETGPEVLMSQAGTGIDLDGFVDFIKCFREDIQHTNTSPSLSSEGSPPQDEPKVPSSDPGLVLPHLELSEPWKQRNKQEIRAGFDAADKQQLKSEGGKSKASNEDSSSACSSGLCHATPWKSPTFLSLCLSSSQSQDNLCSSRAPQHPGEALTTPMENVHPPEGGGTLN